MKTIAILFMILIFCLLIGFGLFYILGFAMSFDAPGSDKDPKAWMMRILMFMPVLVLAGALIVSIISFSGGHYKRSVIISGVPIGMAAMFIVYMFVSSFTAMADFRKQQAIEQEDARKYPVQKFVRHTEKGADTVIVFPNRIISYRLKEFNGYPYAGPLGEMNEDRTEVKYNSTPDTKLPFEELDQFVNENGRKLTEVYRFYNE